MNLYQNLFIANVSFLQDFSLVENFIPKLVDDDMNAFLTLLPSLDEIKVAVFSLNNDSAPGPDGFGETFYQFYWDFVKKDVSEADV